MLVLIGASASGKTEIAKLLIKKYGLKKMVTYTSRPKRQGEVNGVDYHFLSKEAFKTKIKVAFFLETSRYNNHYYGTAFKDASIDKVLIVDIKGANAIYEVLKDDVVIYFIHTKASIRETRMLARGDQPGDIKRRLSIDAEYFRPENLVHVDDIIDNDLCDLDTLSDEIYSRYAKTMKF